LFDSTPPSSRISINPPRQTNKGDRKSPLKDAIINTLQNAPATILINPHADVKRSKSLDQAANFRLMHQRAISKQRAKSATLPPIMNRQLPQASPTSTRWYNRLGNSFKRGTWNRRPQIQYQVK
jgi:hypothetical protein